MKAVIWGVGGTTIGFLRQKIMHHDYEIVCFTDNNSTLWGSVFYNDLQVISPNELSKVDYDIIIIYFSTARIALPYNASVAYSKCCQ